MAEVAEITPLELKFRFQLNKQLPAAITVSNTSSERLAFKVKTTTPKKYVVRPSSGIVEPRSTANVQVIMQAQKEFPADFSSCKDKFLVQVKALEAGEEVTAETFRAPKGVRDTKIRVALEGPPAPPSPVPEVNELDESESTRTGGGGGGHHHGDTSAAGYAAAAAAAGGGDPSAENRALRAQLERLAGERDALRAKLDASGRGGARSSAGGALSPASLLPVLLVGVLAFLIGHYLQHPALQELLTKALGGLGAGAAAGRGGRK